MGATVIESCERCGLLRTKIGDWRNLWSALIYIRKRIGTRIAAEILAEDIPVSHRMHENFESLVFISQGESRSGDSMSNTAKYREMDIAYKS